MKNLICLVGITLLFMGQPIFACGAHQDSHQDRWEKFRTEKIAFLTNKLDLSPAEAQKFWPVYNQMEKERMDAQLARRDLEKKVLEAEETISDKEIIKLTREFADKSSMEALLPAKYNEEFLKILPPQKVLKLYKAESEFRMYMFRKYRDNQRNDDSKE
jgi:hypothetical protein